MKRHAQKRKSPAGGNRARLQIETIRNEEYSRAIRGVEYSAGRLRDRRQSALVSSTRNVFGLLRRALDRRHVPEAAEARLEFQSGECRRALRRNAESLVQREATHGTSRNIGAISSRQAKRLARRIHALECFLKSTGSS